MTNERIPTRRAGSSSRICTGTSGRCCGMHQVTKPHNVLYISPVGERGGAETTLLNLLRHHDRRRFAPQVALLKAGSLVGEIDELDVRATVIPVARFRRVTDTVAAVFALRRIIRRGSRRRTI